jgi:hypothetical protein
MATTEAEKKYSKEYYKKNSDLIKLKARKYHLKYYKDPEKRAKTLKRTKDWQEKNWDKHLANCKKWRDEHTDLFRERRIAAKKIVIEHYGGKCACCGESNIWFLTLDHINNDGYKEGRGRNNCKMEQIIRRGFPDDLQLLCYNCNCGKMNPINKYVCPHKWEEL